MPYSPYLDLNRDLKTLRRIVAEHEARTHGLDFEGDATDLAATGDAWKQIYSAPTAFHNTAIA